MKYVDILYPDNCGIVQRGSLVDEPNPDHRIEDMIEIKMPNGLLIEAGWHPGGGQNGVYLVTVTDGLEFVTPPFRSRDIQEIKSTIEFLIHFYLGDSFLTSRSSVTEETSLPVAA